MAIDTVSLIALIVALIALLVAFLQVIQQYASTAYDYRRCSARTMGGWAKHTRRRFIWSEVRFEITFSVPHLGMNPGGKCSIPLTATVLLILVQYLTQIQPDTYFSAFKRPAPGELKI